MRDIVQGRSEARWGRRVAEGSDGQTGRMVRVTVVSGAKRWINGMYWLVSLV